MKSRANHFIDHGHNCQLTLPLALMILVDHKLKTNAIKTQHIHTYKAKQTDDGRTWSNNTKRVKLCHNSNQYAREKETKKNLYIYCIFIEMQKTKWKRDSSFQFWPKEMQLRLVQLSRVTSTMASSQLGFDFGLGFLLLRLCLRIEVLGFGFGCGCGF